MDRSTTPPPSKRARTTRSQIASQLTPEKTRRMEESRLKAKALYEQHLATEAKGSSKPTGEDISTSARKRAHGQVSSSVPESSRDGTNNNKDLGILPARNFKKYVDHDFSKMTDTKGGFLSVEDDPHNKAMFVPEKDNGKPAHMTLKEWEMHKTLKELRRKREGIFEPGLSMDPENRKKCNECRSIEIDWQWDEIFKIQVCNSCKDKFPDKYSLLTKTEAQKDYLLTNPELKDVEIMPHISKPNPHKSHWHDMMLFLRCQVEEFALKKWGSLENLDAEFEKRRRDEQARKDKKFRENLEKLKKNVKSAAMQRNNHGRGKGFGDTIGTTEKHEHTWGQLISDGNGDTFRTCSECGMKLEEVDLLA